MSYDEHLISKAGGDGETRPETETVENDSYGRLWPDGTFDRLSGSHESYARRIFEDKSIDLRPVPASLRPVFARQRVVTTTKTYAAEAVQEPSA